LCLTIVEKIIPEAKKEASQEFKLFPKFVKNKLDFSALDKAIVLTNLLTVECTEYEKYSNVKDFKIFKSNLLNHFINTKEVYDSEMNFKEDGYIAQRRGIMEQFLRLKRIEYLKKLRNQLSESHELPKGVKINWLGQPSQLGYLISELMDKEYIEKPGKGKSEKSLKLIARLIYNTFSIKDAKGVEETSFDNFYKEIWGNSLSFAGKTWVKIKLHTTQ
jgi:hypothetical protein